MDLPEAKAPHTRVFEKQFVIFLAVVLVAGMNSYWTFQNLSDTAHNTDKILENQNINGKKVQDFMAEQRAKDRQTGLGWVEFINALLLDNEQTVDQLVAQAHLNNTNDIIRTNGTHVIFGNHSLPLVNGIPYIDLKQ